MKSAYVFKLFFVIVAGTFFGQRINADYAKWHALGREAFLAYQGHRFDQYMAHPAPGGLHLAATLLLLVVFAALYEVAAFLGAKCVSVIVDSVRQP
jgi:hypothetical protein